MADRDYASRIAQKARRKPGNEALLLFWAITFVVALWMLLGAPISLLPATFLKMNPIIASCLVGATVSVPLSISYLIWARKQVAEAVKENNDLMKIERDKRASDTEAKMIAMKEVSTHGKSD